MLTIGSHIAAGRLALTADLPRKKKGCKCGCAGNCAEKKAIASMIEASRVMFAYGTSEGATAGWDTRGRTGMTHKDFASFAEKVHGTLNNNRMKEDQLRNAGKHEEANKIYTDNKAAAKKMLDEKGVKPKDFDAHMQQINKLSGANRRINVKMSNMFPE